MLSQHVKGFLDKHPHLLHAEAEIAWLLRSGNYRELQNHPEESQETYSDAKQIGSCKANKH